MSDAAVLVWKGQELRTYGEIADALFALESREEAQEFMRVYQAVNIHAYENVGYLAGYVDRETMQRILDWCGTSHPIVGRSDPTPEEAFGYGRRFAEGC